MFTPANKEKGKVLVGELCRFAKRMLTPNLPAMLSLGDELYFFIRTAQQEEGAFGYPSFTSLHPTPVPRSLVSIGEHVLYTMVENDIPDHELKPGCGTLVFIYHDKDAGLVAYSVYDDFDRKNVPAEEEGLLNISSDKPRM